MRVGIDAWGLSGSTDYTGMGQYTIALLDGMQAAAPDITFVAYGGPGERRPAWLRETVEWRAPDVFGPAKLGAVASRLFGLRRAAARDHLDVFHAPGLHVRPSLPPVPSVPCPLVVTIHDLIPVTFYGHDLPLRLRAFYRWNLARARRAGRVITVSAAARDEIAAHSKLRASEITVIPNAMRFCPNADDAALRRLAIRSPYILYAGSYEPRKNLRCALSAYAALVRDGTPYDFVGIVDSGSGHEADVRAHLASLALDGRVHLVQRVPEADLRALYTHASLLFFPSLAEGFGFPPLQAAACGVPVVASDIPALRETMGDGAVFVPPTDVAAMASALAAVLGDEALRTRLTTAAHARVGEYTPERFLAAHARLYREAAAPAARSGAESSSFAPHR